jgi:hypothetical protein
MSPPAASGFPRGPARATEGDRFAAKRRRRQRGKWESVGHLGGFCLLLRTAAVREVGGIDAGPPLEDALRDLFPRLRAGGHRLAVARGAWVAREGLADLEGATYDAAARAATEAAAVSRPSFARSHQVKVHRKAQRLRRNAVVWS